MENSVILTSPIILTLLAGSIILSVYNLIKRPNTFIIALISLVIGLGTLTFALIYGASMQEVLIVLLLLGLINIPGFSFKDSIPTEKDDDDNDV